MRYAIYVQQSGEILQIITGPAEVLLLNVGGGGGAVIIDDTVRDDVYWVEHETGTIHPKGDYPLEVLPLPCTATIEGVEYPCAEQPVFEFDAPGEYVIAVDAGPRFLKKEFTYDYQP